MADDVKLSTNALLTIIAVAVGGPSVVTELKAATLGTPEQRSLVQANRAQAEQLQSATAVVEERLSALEGRFDNPEVWERQKREIAMTCAGAIVAQILPAPPPQPRPDDALPPQ